MRLEQFVFFFVIIGSLGGLVIALGWWIYRLVRGS